MSGVKEPKKGIIKWFSDHKGYGFIVPFSPDNEDIFFHRTDLKDRKYVPDPGDQVEYNVVVSLAAQGNGLKAVNVSKLDG